MKIGSLLKCVKLGIYATFFCLFVGQIFAMDILVTIGLKKEEKINFRNVFNPLPFPLEIRAQIFSYMIGEKLQSIIPDNKKINSLSSEVFKNSPDFKEVICFYYCVLAKEIYPNIAKRGCVSCDSCVSMTTTKKENFILKNIDDFIFFDQYLSNKLNNFNHNQLRSINNILNKSHSNDICINVNQDCLMNYKYAKSLTIENFISSFHVNQLRYLPLLIQAFFIFEMIQIDLHHMEKLNQRRIENNKIQEFVNTVLNNKASETGDLFWLSGIKPLGRIYNFVWEFWDWMDYIFYVLNCATGIYSLGHNAIMNNFLGLYLIPQGIIVGIFGLVCLLIDPWRFFTGLTSITGLYMLAISLINMVKIIKTRIYPVEGSVTISELSTLVERTDIVIQ